MRLAQLAPAEFRAALLGPGLVWPCGSFNVRVRSNLPELGPALQFLYGDFPVRGADHFVDFEVGLRAPNPLRRIARKQVVLDCDGRIPFKPLPRSQALPMLEWGLNWVLSSHTHDHLVIHGAVVERDGRALILAADPGSGKSTLCAALVHGGWRLLSDELTLISLGDGRIQPIARPISLKNASIEIVRGLGPQMQLSAVCRDTSKGDVALVRPPRESVERLAERVLPAMLVFPKYTAGAELATRPVGRAGAVMELVRHTFNYSVLAGEGFDALVGLARQLRAYRVEYSSFGQVLPEIDRLWAAGG